MNEKLDSLPGEDVYRDIVLDRVSGAARSLHPRNCFGRSPAGWYRGLRRASDLVELIGRGRLTPAEAAVRAQAMMRDIGSDDLGVVAGLAAALASMILDEVQVNDDPRSERGYQERGRYVGNDR